MSIRITLSIPCYGRPKRTIRSIECISNQNIDGWEALVVGDCCPIMQDYIDSNYFLDLQKEARKNGNILSIDNLPKNYGSCGYFITNMNIQNAKGKYFVFYANDDIILPNHFENYLSSIEDTNNDFVFFDSYVYPYKSDRISELRYGGIGHSELIVKTEFLQKMPPHSKEYGHDWHLIRTMMEQGKYEKAISKPKTYFVMSVPNNLEQGID
jgi:GT2 family glycosyltransferase